MASLSSEIELPRQTIGPVIAKDGSQAVAGMVYGNATFGVVQDSGERERNRKEQRNVVNASHRVIGNG